MSKRSVRLGRVFSSPHTPYGRVMLAGDDRCLAPQRSALRILNDRRFARNDFRGKTTVLQSILWSSRSLIICTGPTNNYMNPFPATLTSQMAKNRKINV